MTEQEQEAETAVPEEEISEETEQEPTLEALKAELEKAQKELKKANREAADRRKKLDALEAAEEERRKAEMTEVEKLTKERDDALKAAEAAKQDASSKLLKATIISKAAEFNFTDPTDAYALLDKSELQLADDGIVAGLDEALKALAEAKPYMLRAEEKSGAKIGATYPTGGRAGETDAQRRERLGI